MGEDVPVVLAADDKMEDGEDVVEKSKDDDNADCDEEVEDEEDETDDDEIGATRFVVELWATLEVETLEVELVPRSRSSESREQSRSSESPDEEPDPINEFNTSSSLKSEAKYGLLLSNVSTRLE